LCRRLGKSEKGSFLCDPDGLMTLQGSQRVELELEKISHLKSPCGDAGPQRVEAGVAAVYRISPAFIPNPKLKWKPRPRNGHDSDRLVEAFAGNVQDIWGVGNMECDNGILLLVSQEDRSLVISVGQGLEDYFPPPLRSEVLSTMVPHLAEGDFDQGILKGVQGMEQQLRNALEEHALKTSKVTAAGRKKVMRQPHPQARR
ncbi:unnamed protein product, partial [Discosporangium mesarthrocarpum]